MECYTSDSSDSDNQNKLVDFSHLKQSVEVIDHNLDVIINLNKTSLSDIEILILNNNPLDYLPSNVTKFYCLRVLDVSFTGISALPDHLLQCPLTTLIAKNNNLHDDTLPKTLPTTLKELNLSGNKLGHFPEQVLDITNLKYLYLGGNQISGIPKDVRKLSSLQILSIGGNKITEVPTSVGELKLLQALVLCDNEIENLPPSIANLHNLKSLLLHKNRLRTLPPEIIALKNLAELSLRDNPLVVRFVSDMTYNPASLMELAARVVKVMDIPYGPADLPITTIAYLDSGHCCVNPKCKGVFFDNRVEHIKFVDFCGKYRIPLLQYLCSSKCVVGSNGDNSPSHPPNRYMLRKVLLG